jgi:hypothetical protein
LCDDRETGSNTSFFSKGMSTWGSNQLDDPNTFYEKFNSLKLGNKKDKNMKSKFTNSNSDKSNGNGFLFSPDSLKVSIAFNY